MYVPNWFCSVRVYEWSQVVEYGEELAKDSVGVVFDLVEDLGDIGELLVSVTAGTHATFVIVGVELDRIFDRALGGAEVSRVVTQADGSPDRGRPSRWARTSEATDCGVIVWAGRGKWPHRSIGWSSGCLAWRAVGSGTKIPWGSER
ncbi:hypothetical protein GS500_22945 [Rhodococcus hoagii]|nr:hypothetical protein [Prescottella equi]